MSMSPKKKKAKTTDQSKNLKRKNENEESSNKRTQSEKSADELVQAQQRKNFIKACEQVSCQAYFDHKARLLLIYLPPCVKEGGCKHHDKTGEIKEMPSHAQEAFMIDIRSNMWFDALEVCVLFITPTQYLSANVLKEVVEIMLNAHEDEDAECSISDIIIKCQHILMQNFSTHPPCLKKPLRKCYTDFLTSPLDPKDKTFTNRKQFDSDKGLVKYCMNRLEYEISADSKEESLINKHENTPEEMRQSVKGISWQKEKFEIYEVLERKERIDRLMAVLDSIIELLQFDLAIWHSRYTNNLGSHIMRSHRPLMAHILWSNNILFTGAVNNNCRQILKIFVQMVHLQYPERYIRTMTLWLNATIQTFYICENNSNCDYPSTGKYCMAFANDFYKVIAGLPQDSIVRILDIIKPAYIKHIISNIHLKKLLSTDEDCVIRNLIYFIKNSQWNDFPEAEVEVQISREIFPKPANLKRTLRYLTKKLDQWALESENEDPDSEYYSKMEPKLEESCEPNRNHVIHTLYATLEAYLDAYSVGDVQETLDSLNEKLTQHDDSNVIIHEALPQLNSYTVSEQFIKKYRSIYQAMTELVLLLQKLKQHGVPEELKVFKKIDLLDL